MICPSGGVSGKSRLTRPSDFRSVFESGRRSADSRFVILFRPNGLDCARLGFAISRRRLQSAVARNRVKRVVRESFRLNRERLKGLDIVVLAQNQTGAADNAALRQSLTGHWNRIGKCAVS